MKIKELIPRIKSELWRRGEKDPFQSLQTEVNRVFDLFSRGYGFEALARKEGEMFSPSVNVSEDESSVKVAAELPGMDEKDLEVSITGNTLTLQGEKKEETEERKKDTYYSERIYGSFKRILTLPAEVKADKAEAVFKKGVLTITLPKSEKAKAEHKKIAVKSS